MSEYKKLAKKFGCLFSIGKYGFQWLPKDPSGKAYKLFQIVPLDGWITDPNEIIEAMANDPAFSISYNEPKEKK